MTHFLLALTLKSEDNGSASTVGNSTSTVGNSSGLVPSQSAGQSSLVTPKFKKGNAVYVHQEGHYCGPAEVESVSPGASGDTKYTVVFGKSQKTSSSLDERFVHAPAKYKEGQAVCVREKQYPCYSHSDVISASFSSSSNEWEYTVKCDDKSKTLPESLLLEPPEFEKDDPVYVPKDD